MTGSRKPQVCPLHGAPVGTEGAFWGPTGPHRPSRGIGGVLDNRKSTGLSREGDWQAPAARETCSNGPSTTFSLFSSRQGRCFNFTLVRPPYRPVPCSPKICQIQHIIEGILVSWALSLFLFHFAESYEHVLPLQRGQWHPQIS